MEIDFLFQMDIYRRYQAFWFERMQRQVGFDSFQVNSSCQCFRCVHRLIAYRSEKKLKAWKWNKDSLYRWYRLGIYIPFIDEKKNENLSLLDYRVKERRFAKWEMVVSFSLDIFIKHNYLFHSITFFFVSIMLQHFRHSERKKNVWFPLKSKWN